MATKAEMTKEEIKLSDGRKLIYYTFAKQDKQLKKEEEKQTCQS